MTARSWRGRVFIGVSLDGFLARPDGGLDWLTNPPDHRGHEPVGSTRRALEWEDFFPGVDHLVMGRGTYEKVLTFGDWPYADKHVVVLSRTLGTDDPRITVVRSLADAVELLDEHAQEVYVDGGKVVQSFLRADLVDEITVGIAPVLIGEGLPLFGALDSDVHLRLVATHATQEGMVHITYQVHRYRTDP